jgi:FtsP/CotA-like multicopper oxidase with cupredoxin domain
MRLIRVNEGDVVRLRWTSDQPLVLHLHGYDIEKRTAAGAVTELVFTAYATGRFPIHIHEQGAGAGGHAHEDLPLAIIEVYPR